MLFGSNDERQQRGWVMVTVWRCSDWVTGYCHNTSSAVILLLNLAVALEKKLLSTSGQIWESYLTHKRIVTLINGQIVELEPFYMAGRTPLYSIKPLPIAFRMAWLEPLYLCPG